MPAIVGPVQITSNSSGSIVHFGDTAVISPKEGIKTFYGSGSGTIGLFVLNNNIVSGNLVLDTNLIDQPIVGNN
ncbi:spore germination protein [Peribacillus kribbensis]|uniref:spore germination protein n=1 Tax=Peribacillus kribbensis TaxID=356658 RepID=UPI00040E24B1|nr:spore germination protein [Peribacillus kribbensis]